MDTPVRSSSLGAPWQQVVTASACPACGLVSVAAGDSCESCGASLEPGLTPGDSGRPNPQAARPDVFNPWSAAQLPVATAQSPGSPIAGVTPAEPGPRDVASAGVWTAPDAASAGALMARVPLTVVAGHGTAAAVVSGVVAPAGPAMPEVTAPVAPAVVTGPVRIAMLAAYEASAVAPDASPGVPALARRLASMVTPNPAALAIRIGGLAPPAVIPVLGMAGQPALPTTIAGPDTGARPALPGASPLGPGQVQAPAVPHLAYPFTARPSLWATSP